METMENVGAVGALNKGLYVPTNHFVLPRPNIVHSDRLTTRSNSFEVESVDPKNIENEELKKIAEIEQDMWARDDGLGQYLYCNSCGTTYSKEEYYKGVPPQILKETCADIERILGFKTKNKPHACKCCGDELEQIYDTKKHIHNIRYRYSSSVMGLLTLCRAEDTGEIIGFFDGYLDSFGNIFRKEFKNFHDTYTAEEMEDEIKENTGLDMPDNILVGSALGMKAGKKSFNALYYLIKEFFQEADRKLGGDVFGITEAPIGKTSHSIYHAAGAIRSNLKRPRQISGDQTDIFVQPHIVDDYLKKFSGEPKDFLKQNLRTMKEVLS